MIRQKKFLLRSVLIISYLAAKWKLPNHQLANMVETILKTSTLRRFDNNDIFLVCFKSLMKFNHIAYSQYDSIHDFFGTSQYDRTREKSGRRNIVQREGKRGNPWSLLLEDFQS
jgi:hypothetical protein